MGATDWTPNAMSYNSAKYRPHDKQIVRVAKGSWNAVADGTLDAGNADTLDIVTIPANCIILGCSLYVSTAEGANGTIDIGVVGDDIVNDTDFFYDGIAISTADTLHNNNLSGHIYTGANSVDIRVTATTDTADVDIDGAVFDVYVTYIELDSMKSVN